MTTPRTTSLRNGLTCMTPITLSITAKIATPPRVPAMLPLPPASRVPPRTTAAIDIRSYWPWVPIVGLPTLSRASSSRPATAASIEQSTCAVMTGTEVRMPESRATSVLPPTA